MTKRIVIPVLVVLLLGAGFTAYYFLFRSKQQLAAVPKNAAVVVKADLKSMAVKMNPGKLQNLSLFNRVENSDLGQSPEEKKFSSDIISNPLSTGVNVLSDMYLFLVNKPGGEPEEGLVFAILSSSKLEETVKKSPGANRKIEKAMSFNFVKLDHDLCLAWNSKRGILLAGAGEAGKAYASSLLSQNEGQSILANPDFKKFLAVKADIGCYVNLKEAMKLAPSGLMTAGLRMDSLSSGTADVLLNFEQNKITFETDYYGQGKTHELYQVLAAKGLNDDILKTVTDQQVYAEMSVSFDKKKLLALLAQSSDYNQQVGGVGMSLGLTKEELEGFLGNQFSVAVIGATEQQVKQQANPWYTNTPPTQQTTTELLPIITASMNVGDVAVLHKVLDQMHLPKVSGYYNFHLSDILNVDIVETNAGVTFTNNNALAEKLADKKQFETVPAEPVATIMRNNPFSMYLNLDQSAYPETTLSYFKSNVSDHNYEIATKVLKQFKYLSAMGNADKFTVELNMSDGPDNSLYRLICLADTVSQMH